MKKLKLANWVFGFMLAILFTINTAWSAKEENINSVAWKDSAEIYAKVCAYCHEAHVGPQILNRDLSAAYIRAVVRNGSRAMPAFRASEIDDESLSALADFVSQKNQH